ncbi:MAG TPA: hypothetical protein VKY57_03845 [Chitinispirillaceae bacterium]|jgi:hypothetical protein|nr:hypothetical protein [Chitinispirillaceae bacterium]
MYNNSHNIPDKNNPNKIDSKRNIKSKHFSLDETPKKKFQNISETDIKKISTIKPYVARYLKIKQQKPISEKATKLIADTIRNLLQEK